METAMDEIRRTLEMLAASMVDLNAKHQDLEKRIQRDSPMPQDSGHMGNRSNGAERHPGSPKSRSGRSQAPIENEGFSNFLERQRVSRASEVFPDRAARQPAWPTMDRRRSSLFSFPEDDLMDRQNGRFRENFAPTQILYMDRPVLDKSEACVLERVTMHDLIYFQKAFVKAQSTSERSLSYITYIKDHIQTQMVAHARMHGMEGAEGLIFRGRQAISNGDMLAILASMAVPETPQMMRNELKKKLFPKDVSHPDGLLTQQNFPDFYTKSLEYRELFLHQYELLRMVPRIADMVPPLHRRSGHMGVDSLGCSASDTR